MAPRLELFPFRFRDPVTGKWVRARYRAELHEITTRYADFEITGAPEIREISSRANYFTQNQGATPLANLGSVLTIRKAKSALRIHVVGGTR